MTEKSEWNNGVGDSLVIGFVIFLLVTAGTIFVSFLGYILSITGIFGLLSLAFVVVGTLICAGLYKLIKR